MRKVTTLREFDDYGNCIKEVVTDEEVEDNDWDTLLTRITVPVDTTRCDKIRFGDYENDGTGDWYGTN